MISHTVIGDRSRVHRSRGKDTGQLPRFTLFTDHCSPITDYGFFFGGGGGGGRVFSRFQLLENHGDRLIQLLIRTRIFLGRIVIDDDVRIDAVALDDPLLPSTS